jgi:hypothetical protein
VLAVLLAGGAGCDRGCGDGLRALGRGSLTPAGSPPLRVVDCPDGLARCEEGTVLVSRLASLPMPCQGPASACECPWERAADCAGGCAAEGVEVVVDGAHAASQLCAPGGAAADGGVFATSLVAAPDASETPCDEGDRYRCAGGRVVDCASTVAVGRCVRGCFAEGTSIDDDGVSREAAFAILCSR